MRLLIVCVMIVAVATTTAGRPPIVKGDPPSGEQENELTAEAEREAKELAVRFMKRLRETDDFDPLVSEFFVNDFAERIRQLVHDENLQSEFFAFCEREVILHAGADELRRVYLALMNFWNQQELLGDVAWDYVKLKSRIEGKDALHEPGAWGRHLTLREAAVPAEAFRIAQTDLLLDALFNLVRRDYGGGSETEESDQADETKMEAVGIRSVARLSAFTDKLEQCLPLLHRGVERIRLETKALADAHGVSEKSQKHESSSGDEFRVYRIESEPLKSAVFGLPAGTIVIRARIYPYEMALARVDGQLKMLAVYPDFDGD